MIHHQKVVSHSVEIIAVTVAAGRGRIRTGAHFLIKNAKAERLYGIDFSLTDRQAHAKIAASDFAEARLSLGLAGFAHADGPIRRRGGGPHPGMPQGICRSAPSIPVFSRAKLPSRCKLGRLQANA
jgi:hypothetical protein